MRRFTFRLERLLQWRVLEKDQEEGRLRKLLSDLERLEAERVALDNAAREAERSVERPDALTEEHQALANYRRFVAGERERLRQVRVDLETRIQAQRLVLVESERRVEALKNMKDGKLAEWRRQVDKEQADFVDSLVVARWRRPP